LIAGDPRRWAVAAPPDFRVLVVVKHAVVPRWSRRLRKIATAGVPGIRKQLGPEAPPKRDHG
jgi:hypothetical protein